MTTEIFRNMLYGTRIGEVGTSIQGCKPSFSTNVTT